ncbi:ATP-binding protein [Bacillus sp. MUM 13]|uniref:ATP-binding protein n=1 Tax=Bacillus sp. MUM 13 TaxID=1678001 RepID=UPI0008F5AA9B|nr:ATP-binding protein [Bacillus sp. MUM 13]OIK09980.1 hypothetical protein BIV59_15505 [Bacillus sp. MUM 13]
MRRLFDKVFNDHSQKHLKTPSLPSDIDYTDLNFRTKRGYIAKKLCQYADFDSIDEDLLFYSSLSTPSFINSNHLGKSELILFLSEKMLIWSGQTKDLSAEIKNYPISPDIQNAMLKVYALYKTELFTCLDKPIQQEFTSTHVESSEGKWGIYRDVIYAVTQEKFLLIEKEQVLVYKQGTEICRGTIKSRFDVPKCRNIAKDHLELEGIKKSTIMSLLLVLSEAITNTVKHAEEGKMTLVKDEKNQEIRIVVEDNGPGFDLELLPKMTLLAGYSTKKSLGQGFTLMMKMSKRVSLYTSPEGSIIILHLDMSIEKEVQ